MNGPRNDKGLYAPVPVKPQMIIRNQDMVNWNPTEERQFTANRVAFMSQVSPDGKHVLSIVTRSDPPPENNYFESGRASDGRIAVRRCRKAVEQGLKLDSSNRDLQLLVLPPIPWKMG